MYNENKKWKKRKISTMLNLQTNSYLQLDFQRVE